MSTSSPPSRAITPALKPTTSPASTGVSPLVLSSAARVRPALLSSSPSASLMAATVDAGDDSMLGKWVADDDADDAEQPSIIHSVDASSSSSTAWQPAAAPVQRWVIKPRAKAASDLPTTTTPPQRSRTTTPPPSSASTTEANSTPARGILRPPRTPGTGSSVRFGMRLYNDGDESLFSEATTASLSLSQDPTYRFPGTQEEEEESREWASEDESTRNLQLDPAGPSTPRLFAPQREGAASGDADDSLLAVEASLGTEQSYGGVDKDTSINEATEAKASTSAVRELPSFGDSSPASARSSARDQAEADTSTGSNSSASLSASRSGPSSPTVRMTVAAPLDASAPAHNDSLSVSELPSLPTIDDVSALVDASMGVASLDLPSLLSETDIASARGPMQPRDTSATPSSQTPRSAKSSTASSAPSQGSDELSFSDSFLRREMANAVRDLELQQSAEKRRSSIGARARESFTSVMSTPTPAPLALPSAREIPLHAALRSSPLERGKPQSFIPSTSSPLPSPPRSTFIATSSTPTIGPATQTERAPHADESIVSSRGGWATPTWSAPGSAPGSQRPSTEPGSDSLSHHLEQGQGSEGEGEGDASLEQQPASTSSLGTSDPSSPLADKAHRLALRGLKRGPVAPARQQARSSLSGDVSFSFSSAAGSTSGVVPSQQPAAAPSLSLLLGLIRELDELHSLRGEALLSQVKTAEAELARLQALRTLAEEADAAQRLEALQASARAREEQICNLTETLESQLMRRSQAAREDKRRIERLERELEEEREARRLEARDWEMRVAFAREDAVKDAEAATRSREASPVSDSATRQEQQGIDEEEVQRRISEAKRDVREALERDAEIRTYVAEREHAEAVEALQMQLEEARQSLEAAEGDCRARDEAAEELIERKEQVMQLLQELEEAREELRKLQARGRGADEEAVSAEEKSDLQSRIAELEEQLSSRADGEAMQELKSAHDKALEQLEETKRELEAQWEHTERATETEERLKLEIKELRADLEEKEREMEQRKEDMKGAENELEEAKMEQDAMRGQNESLRSRAMYSESLVDKMHQQLDRAWCEKDEAVRELEDVQVKLEEAQARVETLESEIKAARSSETEARELLAQAEDARKESLGAQGQLQVRHAQLKTEYDSLLDSVARMEEELSGAEKRAASLQAELEVMRTEEKQRASTSRIDEASQHQLSEQVSRVSALEREVGDRGIVISRLEKTIARLEEENENYSIALSSKQQELSLLKRGPATRVGAPRKSGVTLLDTLGRRSILNIPTSSPEVEAETARDTKKAQRVPAGSEAARGDADVDEVSEEILQKGPAPARALRRRTEGPAELGIAVRGARTAATPSVTTARRGAARPSFVGARNSNTSTTTAMGPPTARPTARRLTSATSTTTASDKDRSRETTMNLTAALGEMSARSTSPVEAPPASLTLSFGGASSATLEGAEASRDLPKQQRQGAQRVSMARPSSAAAVAGTTHSRRSSISSVISAASTSTSVRSSNPHARVSSLTAPTRASLARRASISGQSVGAGATDEPMSLAELSTSAGGFAAAAGAVRAKVKPAIRRTSSAASEISTSGTGKVSARPSLSSAQRTGSFKAPSAATAAGIAGRRVGDDKENAAPSPRDEEGVAARLNSLPDAPKGRPSSALAAGRRTSSALSVREREKERVAA